MKNFSSDNNPVRKIPLIHRILAYAATDIIHAERLSRICRDWREAVEVYGKPVFAGFAARESREYFRYFYELCEWAPDSTWMLEKMIDAWNENFASPAMEQQQSGVVGPAVDFFNNPEMDRCAHLLCAPACVVAARYNRGDVLLVMYRKGCDVNNLFDINGKRALEVAMEHRAAKSLVVIVNESTKRKLKLVSDGESSAHEDDDDDDGYTDPYTYELAEWLGARTFNRAMRHLSLAQWYKVNEKAEKKKERKKPGDEHNDQDEHDQDDEEQDECGNDRILDRILRFSERLRDDSETVSKKPKISRGNNEADATCDNQSSSPWAENAQENIWEW